MSHEWFDSIDVPITVCDSQGIIKEMNLPAIRLFAKDGGVELIGKSLYACHQPASGEKIRSMLDKGEKNIYMVDRQGVRKLIYQIPWYQGDQLAGLVEFSLPLPQVVEVKER